MSNENEVLVKITSAGTISIPKKFRQFMDLQKGDYVKVVMDNNGLNLRKIVIN